MRKFYLFVQKGQAVPAQLSWSHYGELLRLDNTDEINYYTYVSIKQNLSYRQLHNKIKNREYERLNNKTKEKLIIKEENKVSDFIKNPILIKNSYNYTDISEKILKQLILEDLDNFLNELGEGFTYIKNEYKIKLGDRYNYIDLLLFNYKYNCFVVVELKVTELKSEHVGQIEKYMNYIDKNIKSITQDKTIGIIICKKDNKFIMEYVSDDRIYRSIYSLI
jgi:predicted nuclease of restriction endonuclease-like (RecB) superfamily